MPLNDAAVAAYPLRLGGADDFARVVGALRAAGFSEGGLPPFLKIHSLADLGSVKADQLNFGEISPLLGLFVRLFLLVQNVPRGEVEQTLPASVLHSLLELDLLRPGNFIGECYYTPVFLYPVRDFIIASDRHNQPDGSPFAPPPDIVFPAIFGGTLRFLHLLPQFDVEDALDLCAGSGIGALILSGRARRSVSADITGRATHFARFNRLLNQRLNVEAMQGDLYEPVGNRMFDLIVAHPPYVPSLGDSMVYRDGGSVGEDILRRMVEGLHERLRPGGVFMALSLLLDTEKAPGEQRVRGWLGERQAEFDVVFAAGDALSPREAVRSIAIRSSAMGQSEADVLLEAFRNAGARKLVYGALVIRRHALPGQPAITARPTLTTQTDWAGFAGLLAWQAQRARPDFNDRLLKARPRLSPDLQLKTIHAVVEGEYTPAEFILETHKPFGAATRFELWVVSLTASFNGKNTVEQVHEKARKEEAIPANFGLKDLASLVAMLIERGFLVVEDI